MRVGMATNAEEKSETDRIKDVIRLLNLALEDCHRYLAEAEAAVEQSKQDNRPE